MSKRKRIKSLLAIRKKRGGRDASGQISVRHHGGEHKRFLRKIDWRRHKLDQPAKVIAIEYDPNRTSDIALLLYKDGSKSYILAPQDLKVGDTVVSGQSSPIKTGNCLPLEKIPAGIPIHCLEISPGRGAKFIKSAGSSAYLQSVDGNKAIVKLPSGELRFFNINCKATIGQLRLSKSKKLVKAGDKRRRGIRPTVRGVAQHPNSHPHGGGEGRSSIGMHPKTPWGKPALGKKTRKKKKYSNKLIVKRIN